jgi:hypothetical protein
VASIEPAAGLNDDESVTIRLPVVLQKTSDAIAAWSAADEEQDMIAGSFDTERGRVQPPPTLAVTTGSPAAQTSGDAIVPGVIAAWTPSLSASAKGYAWEWRKTGSGSTVWQSGGELDASAEDSTGVFTARIPWVEIGQAYRVRIQTIGTHGRSTWVTSDPITALGPADSLAAPPEPEATPYSASRIDLSLTQANDNKAREILLFGSGADNPLSANQIGVAWYATSNVTITTKETGLASGETRYYWTRARDQWGNLSDFSDGASATTT